MTKRFSSTLLLLLIPFALQAENNDTNKTGAGIEHNASAKKSDGKKSVSKKDLTEKHVKEQMEREKEYAQKQSFAQGDDYDLSAHEVDPNALPDVPVIEPDYDFDITDVYRDDL